MAKSIAPVLNLFCPFRAKKRVFLDPQSVALGWYVFAPLGRKSPDFPLISCHSDLTLLRHGHGLLRK